MKCPQCGAEMQPGTARVEPSGGGLLAGVVNLEAGLGHVHLYFEPGDKQVLKRGVPRPAFLCGQCGMFAMPGGAAAGP